jgi:multicomponent K+:H+ antiporter subunit A
VLGRLRLPVAGLISAYFLLRGHNAPGGGFVAGLVGAVALVLLYLGAGLGWAQARIRLDFAAIAAWGLLIAGLTGLGAALLGTPFLTSTYMYAALPVVGKVPLASAMLFDLGVYVTVMGATLLILTLLGAGSSSAAQEK